MIRDDRFVLSRRQFAVDLNSLDTHSPRRRLEVTAVWFRRRRGITIACLGLLWDFQQRTPVDALEFLAAHDDGRYGGDCRARWDGKGYWGIDDRPEAQAENLALLRPMIDGYPAAPRGFDGWWRF